MAVSIKNKQEIIVASRKIQSLYFRKIPRVRKSSDEYNG